MCSKTVAFLSTYSEELVQLDKHTLEALLKSNRANHVKEWKAAKNFWSRKVSTLLPRGIRGLGICLVQYVQIGACGFSALASEMFPPSGFVITERSEAIKKLACKNLETALQRKHMSQFPMSSFARIFLEIFLIKLSWTAILCYRKAFSVMFRRSVQLRGGARGERLTVAIMLPGRQDADDWLNFMLSQKNLWPTFTTRGTLTEEVSEQVFSKERRRLQAKHLWIEVKLRWRVLADRMCTKASTRKSKEELDALLFDRAARRNHTNPYEEKPYRGAAIKEVQAWWKQCKEWMAHFKGQTAPLVFDFKSLLKALSGKEAEAQSEVDAFMEHCAKRWQTREGTYQLKRRRLKPDVRDPPEDISVDVDMAEHLNNGWRGELLHGGREPMRG